MEALRERIKESSAGRKRRGRRRVFEAPTVEDFAYGWVLAFDQTLTKTGWALVCHNPPADATPRPVVPGLSIAAGGLIRPEIPALRSFEETFAKAEAMGEALGRVIDEHQWVHAVVHEMPAVIGHRLESSLMAAREIRRANHGRRPVSMISRQQAYATLVGAPHTDKAHGTARVNVLIPREQRHTTHWNQDVHDAVLLGLQHLYNQKRAEE